MTSFSEPYVQQADDLVDEIDPMWQSRMMEQSIAATSLVQRKSRGLGKIEAEALMGDPWDVRRTVPSFGKLFMLVTLLLGLLGIVFLIRNLMIRDYVQEQDQKDVTWVQSPSRMGGTSRANDDFKMPSKSTYAAYGQTNDQLPLMGRSAAMPPLPMNRSASLPAQRPYPNYASPCSPNSPARSTPSPVPPLNLPVPKNEARSLPMDFNLQGAQRQGDMETRPWEGMNGAECPAWAMLGTHSSMESDDGTSWLSNSRMGTGPLQDSRQEDSPGLVPLQPRFVPQEEESPGLVPINRPHPSAGDRLHRFVPLEPGLVPLQAIDMAHPSQGLHSLGPMRQGAFNMAPRQSSNPSTQGSLLGSLMLDTDERLTDHADLRHFPPPMLATSRDGSPSREPSRERADTAVSFGGNDASMLSRSPTEETPVLLQWYPHDANTPISSASWVPMGSRSTTGSGVQPHTGPMRTVGWGGVSGVEPNTGPMRTRSISPVPSCQNSAGSLTHMRQTPSFAPQTPQMHQTPSFAQNSAGNLPQEQEPSERQNAFRPATNFTGMSRNHTASQEGFSGVGDIVEWFNLATPRPGFVPSDLAPVSMTPGQSPETPADSSSAVDRWRARIRPSNIDGKLGFPSSGPHTVR